MDEQKLENRLTSLETKLDGVLEKVNYLSNQIDGIRNNEQVHTRWLLGALLLTLIPLILKVLNLV